LASRVANDLYADAQFDHGCGRSACSPTLFG
jgi:hypothetical protein